MSNNQKITPEMHDDIILWRSQGYSWNQIAKKIHEEYEVEITAQAVHKYYKKHLEKTAQLRLQEIYEKHKGKGSVEQELLEDIGTLNFAIKKAKSALNSDEVSKNPYKLKAAIEALCCAMKTKYNILGDFRKEEDEDPLLKALTGEE
ncbi:hypothetical protein Metvu_0561 [Methanocaldococcus vulcanius M7]|uniref:Uncharacterized protein n=1 Tax=Methanocaldococcus vulcanius (strain ATCC 700851 / DSM 12094 / M7) TaxID=579137 RepID=C9RFR8_METVM|nr:hypothetical protein [Methanocaldococcus vulcanius]ACX72420.1 hypothetical protein Metvu_0561 [Methanocaldococcus vulcanius M7]